ncbi:MAG: type I secretion system permease/ATPase [Halioglobus sp.]
MDNGLLCLGLVAHLNEVPVDASQLQHQYGRLSEPCSTDDILRAAKAIGLKAKSLCLEPCDLNARSVPAIGQDTEGAFFVLLRCLSSDKTGPQYLVRRTDQSRPEVLSQHQFIAMWSGQLILVMRDSFNASNVLQTFNLRWFIPSLGKYRRIFYEVLIASFFLQLFALLTPLFFQVVMDKVLVHQGFTTLNVLALGFVVIATFDAVIGGLRNYLFSHTSNRIDVELGAKLFHHLSRLPLAYFECRQVGQTVARVRELDSIRNFITGTALTLVIDLSFTFIFIAVLWYYSPTLTLIVLASLPVYIVLSILITPILKHRLDEKFRYGAANQAFLTETITGIQTVKSQAVEPQMQRLWEDQTASYVTASFKAQNLGNIANQIAGYTSKLTTLLIIWWGAHLVIAGALTVGQLVAFNMIAGRVTAPILKLVQLWQDFQQAGISLKRLGDILNTQAEPGLQAGRSCPPQLTGAVSFEAVRFRYHCDGALVLDKLSLHVPSGGIVGLVGRSGSGKSTIAKLLQRLYVPEGGRVLVDGVDLAMVDVAWLRRNIGVVQQESFLFNRTVRDNIALSNPGLNFEKVVRCAKISGAHEFILNLPEGYDTLVGEQGSNLSGGQRQRLAIARALVSDPKILILDEATSALDYESERIVQQNMGAISKNRTVFIIAHRLSTVRHCDQIVVLDKGCILEAGSHEVLLASNGYYTKLYGYQNHSPVIRSLASKQGGSTTATEENRGSAQE